MLKIALIDDSATDISDLENKISKAMKTQFELSKYEDENLFIDCLERGLRLDLVFIDIQLNKKNGIDVAKIVNKISKNTNIIYCSSNIDYAQDIFDTKCIYFLKKPIEIEKLKKAIDKSNELSTIDFLSFENNRQIYKVPLNKIKYIETESKWVKFIYSDGNIEKLYMPLSVIISKLPTKKFIQIHKSFIINLDYLKKAKREEVILEGDIILSISRPYIKETKDKITSFVGGLY